MSGGQDDAAMQINDGSVLKIDQRLIENSVQYRGKMVSVRNFNEANWVQAEFFSVVGDYCWCKTGLKDICFADELVPWECAMLIEVET